MKTKNPEKVKEGKRFREAGARFERKVRADLESKGWIVDRWSNQVDLELDKLVKAKSFMGRSRSNGFPDFIIFKLSCIEYNYDVHGIEVKMKGKLSKEEKEKADWLLKNKIFGKIFIASKAEFFKGKVKYTEIKNSSSGSQTNTRSEQAVK